MLAAYFGGFLAVQSTREIDLNITDTTVFKGLCMSLPSIIQRVRDKYGKDYTVENFSDIFDEMFDNVKVSALKNVGNRATDFAAIISAALKPTSIF